MLTDLRKFPAPWFGGKQHAAPAVWAALGDPAHYVEPFCGTCAVLLRRPHECNRTYYSETVNDVDGLLVNALRGLAYRPDETAEAASWYVAEADLTARHLALVRWRESGELARLSADPEWCDARMAGWWLWGCSAWIGSGWCSGRGPWVVGADGRITRQAGRGVVRCTAQRPHLSGGQGVNHPGTREPGVQAKRPHLSGGGQGVNRPQARESGVSAAEPDEWQEDDFHAMTMPELRRWMRFLSARLRHVRIVNGDWSRVVTNGALKTLPVRQGKGVAGVFLDPPYPDTAGSDSNLYAHDCEQVAHQVREWAIQHGQDPQLRIVVAGFVGEDGGEFAAAGWREGEWYRSGWLKGGMGNAGGGEGGSNSQQDRERLWLSPHCLGGDAAQMSLFGEDE